MVRFLPESLGSNKPVKDDALSAIIGHSQSRVQAKGVPECEPIGLRRHRQYRLECGHDTRIELTLNSLCEP